MVNELANEYQKRGYVVVDHLIGTERVEMLRERLRQIAEGEVSFPKALIEYEPGADRERCLSNLRKVNRLAGYDETFLGHARTPAILDIVEQLIGANIRLFSDQAFMKPPGGIEKTYHQDSAYFQIEPANLVTCWLALDDVTLENGCLWVIPGSHLEGIKDHSQDWDVGDRIDKTIPEEALKRAQEVPITLRAGSCSFHHSVLLHRSGPNNTSTRRRGIATHYMSATSRWVGEPDQKPDYPLLRGQVGVV